jgi:hypothetical protein
MHVPSAPRGSRTVFSLSIISFFLAAKPGDRITSMATALPHRKTDSPPLPFLAENRIWAIDGFLSASSWSSTLGKPHWQRESDESRYEIASEGILTTKDPIGFGGMDGNLYVYVFSDPVNLIDPSGLISSCGTKLVIEHLSAAALEKVAKVLDYYGILSGDSKAVASFVVGSGASLVVLTALPESTALATVAGILAGLGYDAFLDNIVPQKECEGQLNCPVEQSEIKVCKDKCK